jgi:hypothetical protein
MGGQSRLSARRGCAWSVLADRKIGLIEQISYCTIPACVRSRRINVAETWRRR